MLVCPNLGESGQSLNSDDETKVNFRVKTMIKTNKSNYIIYEKQEAGPNVQKSQGDQNPKI